MDMPDVRYRVDQALLNAHIIPERLRRPSSWQRTTGRGGVYETQEGVVRVVCEALACPNNFHYRAVGEPPDAGLKKLLQDRGWGFHEHYTEEYATPVIRTLWCPEHGGAN